jgi:hypothetical protein
LVCVAFGGQQSGRERERGWPFFSTLPALPIWISYGPLSGCGVTGLGSKPWAWEISFSPPRRKRRHQDFSAVDMRTKGKRKPKKNSKNENLEFHNKRTI